MAAVEVEMYRKEELLPVAEPEDIRRSDLAAELGLERVAAFVQPRPDDAAMVFEELMGQPLRIWRAFLPARYRLRDGDWSDYAFDLPPVEALEEISTAKGMRIFHDIEIWTAEGRPDPMAVGVIYPRFGEWTGARYFAIARWGDALLPYESIKATVRQTESYQKFCRTMAMVFLAILVLIVAHAEGYLPF